MNSVSFKPSLPPCQICLLFLSVKDREFLRNPTISTSSLSLIQCFICVLLIQLLHHHSFTLNNHSIFHCGVFFLSCLSLLTHWATASPSLVFAVSPKAETRPPISGHTSKVHASDAPLYFIFENSVMAVVREINCDLPVFRGVSQCLTLFLLYYFQPLRQCVFLSNIPHLSLVTFNFLL